MYNVEGVCASMLKKSSKAGVETAPPALGAALEPTCVAIIEMGSDDLFLGAVAAFLEPCDLHHLFLLVHLVTAGKPGLALSQGALGGAGLHWLHKDALGTRHCREKGHTDVRIKYAD